MIRDVKKYAKYQYISIISYKLESSDRCIFCTIYCLIGMITKLSYV